MSAIESVAPRAHFVYKNRFFLLSISTDAARLSLALCAHACVCVSVFGEALKKFHIYFDRNGRSRNEKRNTRRHENVLEHTQSEYAGHA